MNPYEPSSPAAEVAERATARRFVGGRRSPATSPPATESATTTKALSPAIASVPTDLGPRPTRADSASIPGRRRHLARNAVLSVAAGLTLALLLPFAPIVPATESGITGAALLGLALGWLLLGLLARPTSNQGQGWLFGAAGFFTLSGLLLVTLGAPAHRVLDWVWPLALLAIGAWGFTAIRHHQEEFSRGVLYPVAALLVLASAGGGVETVAEAADAQAHPVPGRLIDVGDHRLHLRCTGTGQPTVVFEAGGGEMSSNVGRVSTAVAHTTRICTYDRAGRGWSEPTAAPVGGAQLAIDLHNLLHHGGVTGPYVLAGHSFGGLYIRNFAARYPTEVAGMVLVDSTAPQTSTPGAENANLAHRVAALASISARFGLIRILSALTGDGELPSPFKEEIAAESVTASYVESTLDEYADAGQASRLAASVTSIGEKPLVVLTAALGHPQSWFVNQDRMTALSSDSVHRTVPGSDHEGMVRGSAGSAATTRGILDVVKSIRTGQPLDR